VNDLVRVDDPKAPVLQALCAQQWIASSLSTNLRDQAEHTSASAMLSLVMRLKILLGDHEPSARR